MHGLQQAAELPPYGDALTVGAAAPGLPPLLQRLPRQPGPQKPALLIVKEAVHRPGNRARHRLRYLGQNAEAVPQLLPVLLLPQEEGHPIGPAVQQPEALALLVGNAAVHLIGRKPLRQHQPAFKGLKKLVRAAHRRLSSPSSRSSSSTSSTPRLLVSP